MPENDDLLLLEQAARAAGEVALALQGGGDLNITQKPDDAGPVTKADLAANDILREHLTAARPDYGWLSEESPDSDARQSCEAVFIVDPIDGTRSFIDGSGTWAHSIAVVRGGVPVAGAVFLPARDMMFGATKGQGAWLNGAPIRDSDAADLAAAEILTTRNNLEARHWSGPVPQIKRHHRPSLAYRLCLVAMGRFDAMFTFRPSWEWDVAAGCLIAAEAGATVTDKTGAVPEFNNPVPQTRGLVAGAPGLHSQIISRLT